MNPSPHCLGCAAIPIKESDFDDLNLISSDCKPVPGHASLWSCPVCGLVQKSTDTSWQNAVKNIYSNYAIYYQGGGSEQKVWNPVSQTMSPRSTLLLEKLNGIVSFASQGKLLDMGCGNGAFFKSFHKSFPQWKLSGTEANVTNRKQASALPGVENIWESGLHLIEDKFDVILAMHLLEHIEHPGEFLSQIARLLKPQGHLIIQTPDAFHNPFDLLILDHCLHFSESVLGNLLERHGFIPTSSPCIPKELTFVATLGKSDTWKKIRLENTWVKCHMTWLKEFHKKLAAHSSKQLGIFGTSIAATWIASSAPEAFSFFVDEDADRINHSHLNKPIFSPADVLPGSRVVLAMAEPMASILKKRLSERFSAVEWI